MTGIAPCSRRLARATSAASPRRSARAVRGEHLPWRSLALSEAGLTILGQAGFSKRNAAGAWRALWSYTFGFATFALAPTEQEARRRTLSALAALPDEEYPALSNAADELAAAFASEKEFKRGLERLLDGVEASLAGPDSDTSAP